MSAKIEVGIDRTRELAIFAVVAEQGSFSAAGRIVQLSPSAVSRTIDRIEERLRVRLLLRSTRSLVLTMEGRAYLAIARRILADLDESEQQLANQGAPRGKLRVSASLAHGRKCIVPLLSEFTALYPEIVVDISLSDDTVDIGAGEADVAIRFGNAPEGSLAFRKLGESRRLVVASPKYLAQNGTPNVPQDLHQHNCLQFSVRRASSDWTFAQDGKIIALKLSGGIESNNAETLAQLAEMGVGITRVAEVCIANELKAGALVPILDEFDSGDNDSIHAVYVGGTNMPVRIQLFVNFLHDKLFSCNQ